MTYSRIGKFYRRIPIQHTISLAVAAASLGGVAIGAAACAPGDDAGQTEAFPVLTGEYLGQTPPGAEPEPFAPGIISTGMYTRDVAMTPAGDEMYFGLVVGGFNVILQTRRVNGQWTRPEIAPFAADPRYMQLEPTISADGQRLFFLSNRPPDGSELADGERGTWANQDIWVVDRVEDGWGEPYNIGPPINTEEAEFYPSLTRDGTMYFTRQLASGESYIFRSRWVDGAYQEPERLGPEVNSTGSQFNAFVAPDESYVIVPVFGRDDSLGSTDYYIVFRSEDDTWTGPFNLGPRINTSRGGEHSAYVSADGRFLFFMSSRGPDGSTVPPTLTHEYLASLHGRAPNGSSTIYWADASFLEELRP
jgi:hypothetical protein